MPRQSTRYCFTISSEPGVEKLLKEFQDGYCRYLIYRLEYETSLPIRRTLHGFFTMKKKLSISGIHAALRRKLHFTHLAAATDTSLEIADRLKKNDNNAHIEIREYGNPYPGERTDLHLQKKGRGRKRSRSEIIALERNAKKYPNFAEVEPGYVKWLKASTIAHNMNQKKKIPHQP
jgi:hypothetical protein